MTEVKTQLRRNSVSPCPQRSVWTRLALGRLPCIVATIASAFPAKDAFADEWTVTVKNRTTSEVRLFKPPTAQTWQLGPVLDGWSCAAAPEREQSRLLACRLGNAVVTAIAVTDTDRGGLCAMLWLANARIRKSEGWNVTLCPSALADVK